MNKKTYILFHLNINFSSIAENKHKEIIKKCYYPILDIIKDTDVPIAIEATGYTLEIINKIDKNWIKNFKKLIKKNKCTFIGSGYCQIIGPFAPYEINIQNQKIGKEIYKKILGVVPKIALVNEMAFSKSLIQIYKSMKYEAIILDYNNEIKEILKNNNYNFVSDDKKNKIQVIWCNSIYFQKFQNYIHNYITFNDYYSFIKKNKISNNYFSLYASDAEIFNQRNRRFGYENRLNEDEWNKIKKLIYYIKEKKDLKIIDINNLLIRDKKNLRDSFTTNAINPVLVKKQDKYNINRWLLSGRNDNFINSICFELYNYNTKLKNKKIIEKNYKKICYFFSSDFRTHTESKKWMKFLRELKQFYKSNVIKKNIKKIITDKTHINKKNYEENNHKIEFKLKNYFVSFNKKKGFAIDKLYYNSFDSVGFGTIYQGNINLFNNDFDFFSGNLKAEFINLKYRFTDLIENKFIFKKRNGSFEISTLYKNKILNYNKNITLLNNKIVFKQNFETKINSFLILRPLHFTFLSSPEDKIYIKYKSGGKEYENFLLTNNFDHTNPINNFISSRTSLVCSDRILYVSFNNINYKFDWLDSKSMLMPMLQNQIYKNTRLTRIIFSLCEIDDTSILKKYNFKSTLNINMEN